MQPIPESELIINPDGSIYHLQLRPEQIADTIITVGDPDRVSDVSRSFDSVQHRVQHREFVTHTGYLNNKRITVISTGIGTDNVDIVLNELDALVNIDFATRTIKPVHTSLQIIRLGTSGSVDESLPVDSYVVSENAIGMDGLMNFYDMPNSIQETVYLEAFTNYMKAHFKEVKPYFASASPELLARFEPHFRVGTTLTATGFYAPQGRMLRAQKSFDNFIPLINAFRHKHYRITNLEMETAGIFGLGKMLGHHCIGVSAILANRIQGQFSKQPQKTVQKLIEQVLEIVTT